MKILSIGNSFSQDAHKCLSQIAKAYGDDIKTVNLFIGGCSLKMHWENFVADSDNYGLELNGDSVGKSSIKSALLSDDWDVITLQQVSHKSGDYSTFLPYLTDLYYEIRKISKNSRFYIHQTWAYETDSTHSGFAFYDNDQKKMYEQLTESYFLAAKELNCQIIPAGEVIQYIRENCSQFDYNNGGISLNRDGFHLSHLYGRYAAALTWYAYLFKADVREVKFIPTYEGVTADTSLLQAINNAVYTVVKDKIK